ncbi:MAG: molybdenum cofactor guanylyltransferase [Ramlibacter sp.]|nr:molybdenum cofactor guanylyltransferase [Ramlibacter sp.]
MVARADITGLVLAGGQGRRMGGLDKGLALLDGPPLAQRALDRLRPQVGPLLLSANRHLDQYREWGVPVVCDASAGYPGPLAGLLAGLTQCTTPWLACVPCDAPAFPTDLVARLGANLGPHQGAVVTLPDAQGEPRMQPVFCLLSVQWRGSLQAYLDAGGRRVSEWLQSQPASPVLFDQPGDGDAFVNVNTLAELRQAAT